MKLHEIIHAIENDQELSYENIFPYKKTIYSYFKDQFCCEPVVMVTFVCNAIQGAKIVPSNEFTTCVTDYIGDPDADLEDNENYSEFETICSNSIMLSDVIR